MYKYIKHEKKVKKYSEANWLILNSTACYILAFKYHFFVRFCMILLYIGKGKKCWACRNAFFLLFKTFPFSICFFFYYEFFFSFFQLLLFECLLIFILRICMYVCMYLCIHQRVQSTIYTSMLLHYTAYIATTLTLFLLTHRHYGIINFMKFIYFSAFFNILRVESKKKKKRIKTLSISILPWN